MENRVLFQKPNLKELSDHFAVADIHSHSTYSDGINTIPTIVKHVKKLGIGIAITDHNAIGGAVEIDTYKDVFSIPGIEVTSKEGSHVLIFFYSIKDIKDFYRHHVKPYMGSDVMSSLSIGMIDIIKRARTYNTVIIMPHPYAVGFTGVCNSHFTAKQLETIFSLCDGIEGINSENLHKWNTKSTLLGFNLNKAITGGSDAHTLYHIGKVVTYAKCKPTRKAFLDAIKARKNKVIGKEIDILRKATSNTFKLKTTLKNYPDIIEKNIKYSYTILNKRKKVITKNVKVLSSKIKVKTSK